MYHEGGFGFQVLGIVYGTFAFSSLFAPLVNGYIEHLSGPGNGEKFTMILASMGFVFFIFSLGTGIKWIIVVGRYQSIVTWNQYTKSKSNRIHF
jgi:hypothetical protein